MEWVHRFRAAGAAADLDDLGVEGDGESLPVSVLPRERGGVEVASTKKFRPPASIENFLANSWQCVIENFLCPCRLVGCPHAVPIARESSSAAASLYSPTRVTGLLFFACFCN